jgi:hypothetical protein
VEGGFREASHIVRVAILDWTPASLLNLIVRRLLSNDDLVRVFEIDKDNVLRDFPAQSVFRHKSNRARKSDQRLIG